MGARDRSGLRGWRRATLVGIKTVHTAAFFSIGSCLAYFAYSSLAKRSDRRAAIAGAVVSGETIVYALNSFRCPLTSLAERLGSEHGSVADIYLPPWIEDHLPYVTGPIFAGAVVLHARNILRSREHSTTAEDLGGDALGTMRRSPWVPGSVTRFRSTTQSKGARDGVPGSGREQVRIDR
jgi:hypothetical protein